MPVSIELVKKLNAEGLARGARGLIPQFDNIATQAQYRVPYSLTAQYVHAGDRVLDWGCGNGHFSLFLESLGAHVTGYSFEPPPAVMRNSQAFAFVAGSEADPRSLPFTANTFDVAVGVGVLEHVWETGGDEASSLAELARVLRPGGVLLTFHLPNRFGWIEPVVKRVAPNKHFHERKFARPDIERLWHDAGFEILNIGLYNSLPRAELRLLPNAVKQSGAFTLLYDGIDGAMTALAPTLCTNYFIAARLAAR